MTATLLDIVQHNDCYTNPVRHLHSWPALIFLLHRIFDKNTLTALNGATMQNCLKGKAGLNSAT